MPLQKIGICNKEHKLPIAIESFPGNTLDHLTLRSALAKNIDGLAFSRFILISDRGICCYPNLLHLKDENGNRRTTEEKVAVYWSKNLSCVQNRKTKSFMIS